MLARLGSNRAFERAMQDAFLRRSVHYGSIHSFFVIVAVWSSSMRPTGNHDTAVRLK